MKHFKDIHIGRQENEINNLGRISSLQNVTHFVGKSDDGSSLLVEPIGLQFAELEDFCTPLFNKKQILTTYESTS